MKTYKTSIALFFVVLFAATPSAKAEGPLDRGGSDTRWQTDVCAGMLVYQVFDYIIEKGASFVPYCPELAKDYYDSHIKRHFCVCRRELIMETVHDRITETIRTYAILCGVCSYTPFGRSKLDMEYPECTFPENSYICKDVIREGWHNVGECRSITEWYELP